MNSQRWASASCASIMVATLILQPFAGIAQERKGAEKSAFERVVESRPVVEIAPRSSELVARYTPRPESEPVLSTAQKVALLQKKVKYVFVLFQENRSFDFYFGSYPGAMGLFSQPAGQTPGFVQPLVDTTGNVVSISPFLIPQTVTNTASATVNLYPEDTDSVNHGHTAIDAKLDLNSKNVAQNDRYAFTEEGLSGTLNAAGTAYTGPAPTLAQKQKGELVVAHVDCATAPFMWNYADRFTLFDNFFDTVIGPSTPNAIAMIAGQSGETQWIRHPELGSNYTTTNAALPITSDPQPFWGSALDVFTPPSQQQPTESGAPGTTNPASNLTFASLPLTFMGNQAGNITAQDLNPAMDLSDIQQDIAKLAGSQNKAINWAWFQEGYDKESTDPSAGGATHANYIAHHNAVQYFGYEANNPAETANHLKGLGDFFTTIESSGLPATGGVFYIRGGYGNLDKLKPRSASPSVQANFPGNDDHPGYSDLQISEALLADEVNAIASSKYWPESAIIITYDETDGLYDHAQPRIRSWDPLGKALDQGPRIPTIIISPFGMVHAVSHEPSEHGSIIKFIDALFNLIPLSYLPDEAQAQNIGKKLYGQDYLGPSDNPDLSIGALLSAFDNGRLTGATAPLPASYAIIPTAQITSLPHFAGEGCRILEITPTDYQNGVLVDPAPADFNPRPSSNPGNPTTPGWPTN